MRWRCFRPWAWRRPWSSNRAPSSIDDEGLIRGRTRALILGPTLDPTQGLIRDPTQGLIRDPIPALIRALVDGNENLTGRVSAYSRGRQPSDLNLEFDHR